jgi:hypothetical protein
MGWGGEDLDRIRDGYWRTRAAECPSCRRALDMQARRPTGADRLELVAECRPCGESWTIGPEGDPLRERFRDWTQEEKLALLVGFGKGGQRCPVDGSLLDESEEPVGGSVGGGASARVVRCGRCWRTCAESR